MGHASITTTLDLYGHLYPGEMAATLTVSTARPKRLMRPDVDGDTAELSA